MLLVLEDSCAGFACLHPAPGGSSSERTDQIQLLRPGAKGSIYHGIELPSEVSDQTRRTPQYDYSNRDRLRDIFLGDHTLSLRRRVGVQDQQVPPLDQSPGRDCGDTRLRCPSQMPCAHAATAGKRSGSRARGVISSTTTVHTFRSARVATLVGRAPSTGRLPDRAGRPHSTVSTSTASALQPAPRQSGEAGTDLSDEPAISCPLEVSRTTMSPSGQQNDLRSPHPDAHAFSRGGGCGLVPFPVPASASACRELELHHER